MMILLKRLTSMIIEIVDEQQRESLLDLLEFLTSWLVEHIYKQDKLIAEAE